MSDVRPLELQIRFKSATLEEFVRDYGRDLRQRGIFIRSRNPLPVGSRLGLDLRLAGGEGILSGLGEVKSVVVSPEDVKRPVGMEIQIREVAPADSLRFEWLERCARGGTRFEVGRETLPNALLLEAGERPEVPRALVVAPALSQSARGEQRYRAPAPWGQIEEEPLLAVLAQGAPRRRGAHERGRPRSSASATRPTVTVPLPGEGRESDPEAFFHEVALPHDEELAPARPSRRRLASRPVVAVVSFVLGAALVWALVGRLGESGSPAKDWNHPSSSEALPAMDPYESSTGQCKVGSAVPSQPGVCAAGPPDSAARGRTAAPQHATPGSKRPSPTRRAKGATPRPRGPSTSRHSLTRLVEPPRGAEPDMSRSMEPPRSATLVPGAAVADGSDPDARHGASSPTEKPEIRLPAWFGR
jgi:hypothetical protein